MFWQGVPDTGPATEKTLLPTVESLMGNCNC